MQNNLTPQLLCFGKEIQDNKLKNYKEFHKDKTK